MATFEALRAVVSHVDYLQAGCLVIIFRTSSGGFLAKMEVDDAPIRRISWLKDALADRLDLGRQSRNSLQLVMTACVLQDTETIWNAVCAGDLFEEDCAEEHLVAWRHLEPHESLVRVNAGRLHGCVCIVVDNVDPHYVVYYPRLHAEGTYDNGCLRVHHTAISLLLQPKLILTMKFDSVFCCVALIKMSGDTLTTVRLEDDAFMSNVEWFRMLVAEQARMQQRVLRFVTEDGQVVQDDELLGNVLNAHVTAD